MKIKQSLAIVIPTCIILVVSVGIFMESKKEVSDFEVRQKWFYKNRPQDKGSYLTILKIENHEKMGRIIHIAVSGVKVNNVAAPEGISKNIMHIPASEESLRSSVTKLKSKWSLFLPDYKSGYEEWENAEGGVFTEPVAQLISNIERTLSEGEIVSE